MSYSVAERYALEQPHSTEGEFLSIVMDFEAGYGSALSDVKADVVLLELSNGETIKISRKNLAFMYEKLQVIQELSESTGEYYSNVVAKHTLKRIQSIKE